MRRRQRANGRAGFVLVALLCATGAREAAASPSSTSPAQAYDLGDVPSARAVGMGGALNALGVSTASLYLNPANMSLARVYHLEALGAVSPEARGEMVGLAVVDSVLNTSRLAGGVSLDWSQFDPDGIHRNWTDARAGLSMPVGDHLSFGATGRWLRANQNISSGPFGASLASDGTASSPILSALTFDLGATLSVLDGLQIGLVGHNLTNPGTALAPTTAASGIGYTTPTFAIEADGLLDFTTWGSVQGRVMGGAEAFVAERYALRAGWRYDTGTRLNSPSLGLGYIDPKWSVELGVRHDIVSEHASTLVVLSLRYFYDPTGGTTPPDEGDPL